MQRVERPNGVRELLVFQPREPLVPQGIEGCVVAGGIAGWLGRVVRVTRILCVGRCAARLVSAVGQSVAAQEHEGSHGQEGNSGNDASQRARSWPRGS